MKDTPKATRGELQAIDKGSHIWLLRYDKQWYERSIAKKKEDEEKPVRITKGYLLRFI